MRIERRQFLYVSAAAIASLTALRPAFAQERSLAQALDPVLKAPIDRGDFPGVVGAITNATDTIYTGVFGTRALGSDVAMTEETVFDIASMTKPIAGACAMQLVEQGKLDLESPFRNGSLLRTT